MDWVSGNNAHFWHKNIHIQTMYILYRAIYIYSATHTHKDIFLCLYGDELIWLLKFALLVLYLDSLSHNTEWIPYDKISITFGETVHKSGIRLRSLLRQDPPLQFSNPDNSAADKETRAKPGSVGSLKGVGGGLNFQHHLPHHSC